MKAEETTASTSLLKDCFPGSSIEEVHGMGGEIHGGRANKASDKDIGGEVKESIIFDFATNIRKDGDPVRVSCSLSY